jgi:hypothetical protein
MDGGQELNCAAKRHRRRKMALYPTNDPIGTQSAKNAVTPAQRAMIDDGSRKRL